MPIEKGWSVYFRMLIYYGILPISLSKEGHVVSTTANRKVYYRMFIVIQTLIVSFFVYGKMRYWSDPLGGYGSTGQSFEFLEEITSGIIHIILHSWMFFSRGDNLKLVKNLWECDRKAVHLVVKECNHTFRNCIIASSCLVFFYMNVLIICLSYYKFKVDFLFEPRTIIMMEYIVNFTHATLIISFYTCLVWKVRTILERVNKSFENIARSLNFSPSSESSVYMEMKELFTIRNKVLVVCACRISSIYGFANLLVSAFMLMDMTHVPYYLVYRLEQEDFSTWKNIIYSIQTSVFYIAPKIVVFVLTFTCNNLEYEVSRLILIITYTKH